jgi:hypothetical protein
VDRRLEASIHAPSESVGVPVVPPESAPLPVTPPRRIICSRCVPNRLGNWANSSKVSGPADRVEAPKTWKQLLKSPDKARWLKAADNEFAFLAGMETWTLVPRPTKRQIIKSKWVFKVKRHPDHSIQKLKGRLVAMGYSQIHEVDYEKVFSPTLQLETLRMLYSLMAIKNWAVRQVDFKTAFLNGHLDKPIFMEQPPGFKEQHHPDYVCEVKRSFYGLKQAPRQWNIELHDTLIKRGLSYSVYDPTLYFKVVNNKLIGAISIHVDDLSVIGEQSWVSVVIDLLGKCFKIGATEELSHFLSLKITQDIDNRLVFLSQAHYIKDVQKQFLPNDNVNVSTLSDSSFKDLAQ